MTLGAQLKTAREKKGYTLKQLSEISGLSIGFISQVERGQTDPSLSSVQNKLFRIFKRRYSIL